MMTRPSVNYWWDRVVHGTALSYLMDLCHHMSPIWVSRDFIILRSNRHLLESRLWRMARIELESGVRAIIISVDARLYTYVIPQISLLFRATNFHTAPDALFVCHAVHCDVLLVRQEAVDIRMCNLYPAALAGMITFEDIVSPRTIISDWRIRHFPGPAFSSLWFFWSAIFRSCKFSALMVRNSQLNTNLHCWLIIRAWKG